MGKKDIFSSQYMGNRKIFADVFNMLIYGGTEEIEPEALHSLNTSQIIIPESVQGSSLPIQKIRDTLKILSAMEDENAVYLLLGIEAQSEVNYAMPVKTMLYDAITLAQQVERVAKQHRQSGEYGKSRGEFLSGFYKEDKLIPVITAVVFFSEKKWDGPLCLHDMLETKDPRVLLMVDNYRIHLIAPAELTEEDFSRLHTDLRAVLKWIKYSKDKEHLLQETRTDPCFRQMSDEAINMIEIYTNSKIPHQKKEEGGTVDMCQAFDEILADERKEGRAEGRIEERRSMINRMSENGMSLSDIARMINLEEAEVKIMLAVS